ncbi:MAG: hypothetical protein CSB32_01060 [Desulfobacterales bacterium]|nr:MAG: hypothetical protein CSB32_01060 [Desulfobacterales bacterium]
MKVSLYAQLGTCLRRYSSKEADHSFVVEAEYVFAEEYCGFAGHFPEQPVLPAIVQLAAVRYLAEKILGCSLVPGRVSGVKYKGMILPGEMVRLVVRIESGDEGWLADWQMLGAQKQVLSSGQSVFIEERER